MRPESEPFRWDKKRERAAVLVAEDQLTDVQIAEEIGVGKATLERWKLHPEFRSRVDEHLNAFRKEIRARGIAVLENRVAALNSRWELLEQIRRERGQDPALQHVPGGRTGLIVRQTRGIGGGDNFQVIQEYEVDTGLLREFREHERQAAQELGQWRDRPEPEGQHGAGELPITEVVVERMVKPDGDQPLAS